MGKSFIMKKDVKKSSVVVVVEEEKGSMSVY